MANLTKTTCSRCGGSGHYSFNLIHGTVCFRCGGVGFVMVNLKNEERNKRAKQIRESERVARCEMMRRLSQEVISEWNANYNFDTNTELGIDQLNRKVWEATGRTIWEIRDERAKAVK